ncbi:helix-turn-helix transcriptional regulator [Jatrophihabitans endophyticus]|uniref:helix-turn-helix transcriptional regulator n=1 Tax=Jatrophihabitans endophyticus TaxID=1206085 RepID=UPI0019FFAB07|nr:helix-turn-helix transcriptional regulator [Jatrophihabitans endophyticus]MBE7188346.1 helix-turn-helix domain-containing protein [Jatrophihabitans endophyticus]
MDRSALADLLRSRRERLTPADVGVSPGVRRRTPGLRRDEVAALAAISTDYYTRLEQRRGPHPSVEVLASLARALRFTGDERDHLFHLAGQEPPTRHVTDPHLSPGLLHLLDRLTDCPAMVVDDLGVVLAQNAMSVAVTGDSRRFRGRERYVAWRWFCVPGSRSRIPEEDWHLHSRTQVADLRATHGRRRTDPEVAGLVDALRAGSTEFAALWDEHEVAVRRADAKRVVHPEVGLLDLLCETLVSAVGGQTLVVLYPRPGTDARDKLDLLRVIGTQDLSSVR